MHRFKTVGDFVKHAVGASGGRESLSRLHRVTCLSSAGQTRQYVNLGWGSWSMIDPPVSPRHPPTGGESEVWSRREPGVLHASDAT